MVVFVALHSKIDTAEASEATSKRFISFSHHHFPPHAPHSFWMFSCLNGFLLPPKLNLMIDDDVYTMRSRLFICDCLFLLLSNALVDISFWPRPSRSLAIDFFRWCPVMFRRLTQNRVLNRLIFFLRQERWTSSKWRAFCFIRFQNLSPWLNCACGTNKLAKNLRSIGHMSAFVSI